MLRYIFSLCIRITIKSHNKVLLVVPNYNQPDIYETLKSQVPYSKYIIANPNFYEKRFQKYTKTTVPEGGFPQGDFLILNDLIKIT